MTLSPSSIRDRYGEGFYTIFDDGVIIKWEPLSVGDYLRYSEEMNTGIIASSVIEDEIFRKCVISKEYIRNLESLPAGIVSTVVSNIFNSSGPTTVENFNTHLDYKRSMVGTTPLYTMIPYIIKAFPAYKPEDVLAMPYDVFMTRLAQAEAFLLESHQIENPICLLDPAVIEEQQQKQKKPRVNAKDLWEQVHGEKKKEIPVSKQTGDRGVIDSKGNVRVIPNLEKERIALQREIGYFESDDPVERAKMIAQAHEIYKDTIDNLPYYQKQKEKQLAAKQQQQQDKQAKKNKI